MGTQPTMCHRLWHISTHAIQRHRTSVVIICATFTGWQLPNILKYCIVSFTRLSFCVEPKTVERDCEAVSD